MEGAVAVARLAECQPMMLADEPAALCDVYQDAIARVLNDVRPIRPVRVEGQLGRFDVNINPSPLITITDFLHYQTLFEPSNNGSKVL